MRALTNIDFNTYRILLLFVLILFCAGCFVETKQKIIPSDRAQNPWEGYSAVVLEMQTKEQYKPKREYAISILEDNTIALDELRLVLAYSQILSDLIGYRAYLTTIPLKEGTDMEIDLSSEPDKYGVVTVLVNEGGDVGVFTPSMVCSEPVNSLAEAEAIMRKCFDKPSYKFEPLLKFVEGLR